MALRRQQTSLRTVAAYRRALETMGKLAAEQAGPTPATPPNPDSPYVRVVAADATPPETPKPPSLRSRPRRTQRWQPPTAIPEPGPNTRIVTGGDAAVPPASTPLPEPWAQGVEAGRVERAGYRAGPGPAEPYALTPGPIDESGDVGSPVDPTRQAGSGATPDSWGSVPRPVLHFDATDDLPAFEGSSNRADGGPYQPDGSPRSRSARDRSRTQSHRRAPTFRSSRRSGRRWAAAAVAAAVLIVAGVVGFTLVGGTGSPRHHSALNPQTTTTRPAPAPVVPARTTPTTTPTTAILVASSAGSSTYRVGASATITLAAGNGTCWVEIRQAGPYGPVLFTGDLLAGQTRDMNGPVWVRLGNPGAIAVTVNGTSISPPGMTTGEPYDLQFA